MHPQQKKSSGSKCQHGSSSEPEGMACKVPVNLMDVYYRFRVFNAKRFTP